MKSSRPALVVLAAVLFFGLAVPSAFAWGSGGDGYGTHDWVLDEAIGLVGHDASWVDLSTALHATDDPDNLPNDIAHVFHDEGLHGAVPQRVADLYHQACTSYAAGDRVEASRLLGLLSHYYSDILNPLHTADAPASLRAYHLPFEHAVSLVTNRPGENAGWVDPVARVPLVDVRAKTAGAARFARGKFSSLVGALRRTSADSIDVDQPTIKAITRSTLSRAANDLADIVRGIPSGAGLAKVPAVMRLTLSRHYTVPGLMICAYATCTNAAGRPLEGVGVAFSWPGPGGSVVTTMGYSGPNGVAHNWHKMGGTPYFVRSIVRATVSSSGSTIAKSNWFVRSVKLRDGKAGLRATVSDTTPARDTTVTARAFVHDSSGHAVGSMPVTFVWRFKTSTVTRKAMTNSSGVARVSINIGRATRGYRVGVTVRASSIGTTRSASTSFVPH